MAFLPDGMSTKLASLYPALPDTAARFYQWIQDNGPEWWDVIAFVETETSLPFSDGWSVYWTTAAMSGALVFDGDALVFNGDPLVFN